MAKGLTIARWIFSVRGIINALETTPPFFARMNWGIFMVPEDFTALGGNDPFTQAFDRVIVDSLPVDSQDFQDHSTRHFDLRTMRKMRGVEMVPIFYVRNTVGSDSADFTVNWRLLLMLP